MNEIRITNDGKGNIGVNFIGTFGINDALQAVTFLTRSLVKNDVPKALILAAASMGTEDEIIGSITNET